MTRSSLARAALAAAVSLPTPAAGHDWYPFECCHALDCAPVDKADLLRGSIYAGIASLPGGSPGDLIVQSRHGTAIVPRDMPRRESQDNLMHVCMRPQWNGSMRVICIFVPPAT